MRKWAGQYKKTINFKPFYGDRNSCNPFIFCKLLCLLTFLGISACSQTQQVDEHDPQIKIVEGKYYFRDQPFSGILVSNLMTGTRLKIPYLNGMRDGVMQEWFANGQLAAERPYQADIKIDKHRGWYENGALRFEYNFSAGEHDGDFWEWYESGQVYRYKKYDKGREIGLKVWRKNGRIYLNYVAFKGQNYGLLGGRLCITVKGEETDTPPPDFDDDSSANPSLDVKRL